MFCILFAAGLEPKFCNDILYRGRIDDLIMLVSRLFVCLFVCSGVCWISDAVTITIEQPVLTYRSDQQYNDLGNR